MCFCSRSSNVTNSGSISVQSQDVVLNKHNFRLRRSLRRELHIDIEKYNDIDIHIGIDKDKENNVDKVNDNNVDKVKDVGKVQDRHKQQ